MYFTSWEIKGLTGESVCCQRIEDRFYNPIKDSSGSFSNRNLEMSGIAEIILPHCYTLSVPLWQSEPPERNSTFKNLMFFTFVLIFVCRKLFFLADLLDFASGIPMLYYMVH